MEAQQPEKSYLFLVRIWMGDDTDGKGENLPRWQGKVQQVMGGGSVYMADISQLVDLVRSMLPQEDSGEQPNE